MQLQILFDANAAGAQRSHGPYGKQAQSNSSDEVKMGRGKSAARNFKQTRSVGAWVARRYQPAPIDLRLNCWYGASLKTLAPKNRIGLTPPLGAHLCLRLLSP